APAAAHASDASGDQKTLRYCTEKRAATAAAAASPRHVAQPVAKLRSSLKACRASAAAPRASGNIDMPSAYANAATANATPATSSASGVSPSPCAATKPTATYTPDPTPGYAQAKRPMRLRPGRPPSARRRVTGDRPAAEVAIG